ncbi:MAG: hypothetical protein V1808_03410, partial [Candidatus Daviesbacteria bacterium]
MGKTKIKTIGEEVEEIKKPKSEARGDAEAESGMSGVAGEGDPRRVPAATPGARTSDGGKARQDPDSGQNMREKKAKVSKRAAKKTLAQPKARGKKYQEVSQNIEKGKKYPLSEAIQLVQSGSYTKFPGTIEAHLNTAAKGLRGLVSLPFAAGKKLTILA